MIKLGFWKEIFTINAAHVGHAFSKLLFSPWSSFAFRFDACMWLEIIRGVNTTWIWIEVSDTDVSRKYTRWIHETSFQLKSIAMY